VRPRRRPPGPPCDGCDGSAPSYRQTRPRLCTQSCRPVTSVTPVTPTRPGHLEMPRCGKTGTNSAGRPRDRGCAPEPGGGRVVWRSKRSRGGGDGGEERTGGWLTRPAAPDGLGCSHLRSGSDVEPLSVRPGDVVAPAGCFGYPRGGVVRRPPGARAGHRGPTRPGSTRLTMATTNLVAAIEAGIDPAAIGPPAHCPVTSQLPHVSRAR